MNYLAEEERAGYFNCLPDVLWLFVDCGSSSGVGLWYFGNTILLLDPFLEFDDINAHAKTAPCVRIYSYIV